MRSVEKIPPYPPAPRWMEYAFYVFCGLTIGTVAAFFCAIAGIRY